MPIFRTVAILAAAFALFAPASATAQPAPDGRVSILQFIPQSEWAAIRNCRSTYDVTAAKEKADTVVSVQTGDYSVGNGEVDWPAGCYAFAGTLSQKHTVLERGVSSGLPSGGSTVWKFPPSTGGIVIDGIATSHCQRAPKTSSGQGTQLIGITLIGGGGAPDQTSHGVWMCATAQLTDVNIRDFAGDGVHIDPNGVGNTNIFRIYNGFIGRVGRYGLYQHGADANAGLIVGTAISDTGGGCDVDLSFLGNTHVGELCQYAGHGLTRVNAGGANWQCLSVRCGEVPPGKEAGVWQAVKADARFPAWRAGAPYLIAGDYVATDPNTRALFLGVYSEEGDPMSDVRSPSMVEGGLQGSGFTPFSVAIHSESGLGGYVESRSGFGSTGRTAEGKLSVVAVVGGNGKNGDVVRSQQNTVSTDEWRLHWAGADLRDDWNNLDNSTVVLRTGPKTAQTFSRGAAQPEELALPKGVFVGGASHGDIRYVGEAAAMPTKGAYAKGDRILNSDPRVLGKPGARYTITGWLRLTTGSTHAPNKDWVEMRAPTGT
ncbi:MAG TPA: hypothetical protein VG407_07715 [Caulobacteraceae bacterium]|jgi:hypothetical protein|nr:hypothetical protein [Caulobacteraceae bacterium]